MPAFHLLATLSLVSCSISNFCLLLILTGVAVTTTTTTPTKNATPSCNLTSILRREGMERWMDDNRPLHLYYHGKLLILGNIMYDIHYTILKQYLTFMNHSCSKNVKFRILNFKLKHLSFASQSICFVQAKVSP